MNSLSILFCLSFASLGLGSDLPNCDGSPWSSPPSNGWPVPIIAPPGPWPYPGPGNQPNPWEPSECVEHCTRSRPVISQISFSRLTEVTETENSIYVCEPGSRIKRIEKLNSVYRYNVSCNAVVSGSDGYSENIYTAIVDDGNGGERSFAMNAASNDYVSTYNNGNENYNARAPLTDCECDDDVLHVYSSWVVDDALQGCCRDGASYSTGVYGRIEIRGKNCCAVCHLQTSTLVYDQYISN